MGPVTWGGVGFVCLVFVKEADINVLLLQTSFCSIYCLNFCNNLLSAFFSMHPLLNLLLLYIMSSRCRIMQ